MSFCLLSQATFISLLESFINLFIPISLLHCFNFVVHLFGERRMLHPLTDLATSKLLS